MGAGHVGLRPELVRVQRRSQDGGAALLPQAQGRGDDLRRRRLKVCRSSLPKTGRSGDRKPTNDQDAVMTRFRSLFLRMRIVHWLGMLLLVTNALLFTESSLSQGLQLLVAAVIFLHDLDERRWGERLFGEVERYLDRLGHQDLSHHQDIDSRYSTEFSHVVEVVDGLRDRTDGILSHAKNIAGDNTRAAAELTGLAQDMNRTGQRVQHTVDAINGEVEQMQARTAAMSDDAANAADRLQTFAEEITDTREDFRNMEDVVGQSVENTRMLSERFAVLLDGTEQINQVLSVVSNIAEQTNLLALNAAIEAARAGEHGRGFAVVADEVRSLATHTKDSLDKIHQIVEQIESAAGQARERMESQMSAAERLASSASVTGGRLEQSLQRLGELRAGVEATARFAGEVLDSVQQIGTHAGEIRDVVHQEVATGDRLESAARQVAASATELTEALSHFRTSTDDA
ncbi:MAG TPA: methyl-accepting chemotaxis protein [Gammaproteobacteria bacterium]|nr:methyl-accepting chemotaxis protein [Gammaproteobacteria bacterium]